MRQIISRGRYQLSDFERKRIFMARENFAIGQTISNDDVQKEIDKMLNFSFEWESGLIDLKETSVELQHKINHLR